MLDQAECKRPPQIAMSLSSSRMRALVAMALLALLAVQLVPAAAEDAATAGAAAKTPAPASEPKLVMSNIVTSAGEAALWLGIGDISVKGADVQTGSGRRAQARRCRPLACAHGSLCGPIVA
jgi:hypothetical protein